MIIPKDCRITLDEYMEELRKMVQTGKAPCSCCPGSEALISKGLKSYNEWPEDIPECVLCRTLVGCPAYYTGPEISCPCYILGEEEALEMAAMKVEEWENQK